jgi:hypothetical protein
MNKGYGVQVTANDGGGDAVPLAVVARNERDAELVASAAAGGNVQAETFRELSDDEAASYGLDLNRHGDAKALPVLHL